MQDIKVSIIVPVYKVEKYLKRCLESLRNQTLADIEIILVDDSSPDACPEICDNASSEDCRIKVIHKENEGAGPARNAGLKIAGGKYIAFADSDDYVELNMYETLYNAAEKYSADLVISGVKFVDGNMFSEEGECTVKTYFDDDTYFTKDEELKKLRLGIIGSLPHEDYDSKYGMSVWKNLFRRDVIENNGLQFLSEREMLSEDALFMLDYVCCIRSAVGIKDALYNYCRNEDSISKSYKADRLEKSLVFIEEAEKRLSNDITPDEYKIYLNRFIQGMCRVICSQEIMYAAENNVKYVELRKRLKMVCTNSVMRSVLSVYPISKLPVKQAAFAYAARYRLYYIQKIIVGLRSK